MPSVTDNFSFNEDFNGYRISDEMDHSVDSEIRYYGFINRVGDYYIMERNSTTGVTYRYYHSTESSYTAAWTLRESLTYDYFSAFQL